MQLVDHPDDGFTDYTYTVLKRQRFAGLDRGVGLTILSHLADKYDGELSPERNGDTYHTSLVLKAKETANV